MIRSKAEKEYPDHPVGQKADFSLALGVQTRTLVHSGEHPPVAHCQHQQWEQEADAHSDQIEECNIWLHGVSFITAVIVVLVIVGIFEIVINQHHDVHHNHHDIDSDALSPGIAGRTLGLEAQWERDHQAAIHRDTAEQEDADVHVGVVEESSDAASAHPEPPLMAHSVVIHPKWHSENEEHVRDREAEQEDSQNVLSPHLLIDGAQGQHVEQQTEDKSNDVNRHQEDADAI